MPHGLSMAQERPHGRVKPETLRIIDIFIPGEAPEDRLPE